MRAEYNKSHKSTTIKLVWPFTSNDGRENGKRVRNWKPMSIRPQGRPKKKWEEDIRNDMKKLKIKNKAASRFVISGNHMLRKPKHCSA